LLSLRQERYTNIHEQKTPAPPRAAKIAAFIEKAQLDRVGTPHGITRTSRAHLPGISPRYCPAPVTGQLGFSRMIVLDTLPANGMAGNRNSTAELPLQLPQRGHYIPRGYEHDHDRQSDRQRNPSELFASAELMGSARLGAFRRRVLQTGHQRRRKILAALSRVLWRPYRPRLART